MLKTIKYVQTNYIFLKIGDIFIFIKPVDNKLKILTKYMHA